MHNYTNHICKLQPEALPSKRQEQGEDDAGLQSQGQFQTQPSTGLSPLARAPYFDHKAWVWHMKTWALILLQGSLEVLHSADGQGCSRVLPLPLTAQVLLSAT